MTEPSRSRAAPSRLGQGLEESPMSTWGRAPSGPPWAAQALCDAGAVLETAIRQRSAAAKPGKLAGEEGVGRYLVREFTRLHWLIWASI